MAAEEIEMVEVAVMVMHHLIRLAEERVLVGLEEMDTLMVRKV